MRHSFGLDARCSRLTVHRQPALTTLSIFLVLQLVPPLLSTANASLIPTSWTLSTSVQESGGVQAVDFHLMVQAPFFNHSQSAALGPSLSAAQYAFNIGQTVANYVVNVQHRCTNHQIGDFNADPRCSSFGRFILTPSVDVLLTADMSYSFFMPTDPESVGISLVVVLDSPSEVLLGLGDSDNTDSSGPHGGTLSISGASAILPAGRTATVQYQLRTNYFPGSGLGLLATGDGTVHLNMVAIPDPAALAPLAFAALLMRKRRRA